MVHEREGRCRVKCLACGARMKVVPGVTYVWCLLCGSTKLTRTADDHAAR